MSNITNFVDEKTSRRIIDAICTLDFNTIHVLANKSGIPVSRLQSFVDGDEKITHLEKGKLIIHLINLSEKVDEENNDVYKTKGFTSLSAYLLSKTG